MTRRMKMPRLTNMDKMTVPVSISISCTSLDWTQVKDEGMQGGWEEPLVAHIISTECAMG